MKKIFILFFYILLCLIVGCTKLSVKVENLISEGKYVEAKQLLIEEEAGNIVSKDAAEDEEVLLARDRFRELMGDEGEIWAVDRSSTRLRRVVENAERLGVNSIKAMHADSSNLLHDNPNWEGYFQRILVDAPCSGLGTLS